MDKKYTEGIAVSSDSALYGSKADKVISHWNHLARSFSYFDKEFTELYDLVQTVAKKNRAFEEEVAEIANSTSSDAGVVRGCGGTTVRGCGGSTVRGCGGSTVRGCGSSSTVSGCGGSSTSNNTSTVTGCGGSSPTTSTSTVSGCGGSTVRGSGSYTTSSGGGGSSRVPLNGGNVNSTVTYYAAE